MKDQGKFVEVRPISEGTTDFDIAFWQEQGPDAIFKAAWEWWSTPTC